MKKWQFMPVTPSIVGSIFLIKKVAIYACYPLYSWKHIFDKKKWQFMPVTPSIVRSIFLIKKWQFMPVTPFIVGTLCYVRGTPFFLFFFFLSFYEKVIFQQ